MNYRAIQFDIVKTLKSWALITLGILIATHTSKKIYYDSNLALFWVVIILSFFNLVIKPLLVVFTLRFIVYTSGLALWMINACLLYTASLLVDGFYVDTFGAALWGALVISITAVLTDLLLHKNKRFIIYRDFSINMQNRMRGSHRMNRNPEDLKGFHSKDKDIDSPFMKNIDQERRKKGQTNKNDHSDDDIIDV